MINQESGSFDLNKMSVMQRKAFSNRILAESPLIKACFMRMLAGVKESASSRYNRTGRSYEKKSFIEMFE